MDHFTIEMRESNENQKKKKEYQKAVVNIKYAKYDHDEFLIFIIHCDRSYVTL